MRQNIITFYLRGNKEAIKLRMIDSIEDFMNGGKKTYFRHNGILGSFIRQRYGYNHDWHLPGNSGDYLAKKDRDLTMLLHNNCMNCLFIALSLHKYTISFHAIKKPKMPQRRHKDAIKQNMTQ